MLYKSMDWFLYDRNLFFERMKHHRSIQTIAIEMHKVTNGPSLEIMNELIQLRAESQGQFPAYQFLRKC